MLGRDGSYRWTRWNTKTIPQDQLLYAVGIDISETRRDSERVKVGSWDWHLPTDRFSVSETLLDVFAIDGAPWRYQQFLQRVSPGDRRRVDRELRASLAEAQPYSDEFSIRRPDGSLCRLHSAGRSIPGPDGDPDRIRGITIDVTDRPTAR